MCQLDLSAAARMIIGFIVLLAPPSSISSPPQFPRLKTYYVDLKTILLNSPLLALRQVAAQLPSQLNLMPSLAGPAAGSLDAISQVLNAAGVVLSGLFTLTAILLIGFYWTLEEESAQGALLRFMSSDECESAREILSEVERRVGGYVRGTGIMALTIFDAVGESTQEGL